MARQFVTKYELALAVTQTLHMSTAAVILGLYRINGVPCLFCQEEAAPMATQDVVVHMVSTTGEVPLAAVDYIGTVVFGSEALHIYTE